MVKAHPGGFGMGVANHSVRPMRPNRGEREEQSQQPCGSKDTGAVHRTCGMQSTCTTLAHPTWRYHPGPPLTTQTRDDRGERWRDTRHFALSLGAWKHVRYSHRVTGLTKVFSNILAKSQPTS